MWKTLVCSLSGALLSVFCFSPAIAITFTASTSGNWNDSALWTPPGVPNGNDNIADLVLPASGSQTVNLTGGTFTVNQLNVTGTGGGAWTVANGTLIFDGTAPMFTNQSIATGISASLATNLQLNADTIFNTQREGVITAVSGVFSGTGNLIITGQGTLLLTADSNFSGITTISAGILQFGNGGTTGGVNSSSIIDNGV